MPTDEEIRQLCLHAAQANDPEEFQRALKHLKSLLRSQIEDAENLGIHLLLKKRKIG